MKLLIFKMFLFENSKKTINTNGLINYWPINDGNIRDYIGNSDMTSVGTTQNVQDRLGNTNCAVYCSDGYYQIPGGYYVTGPYTFIAWVNVHNFTLSYWPRIFDFSNSLDVATLDDEVTFGFFASTQQPAAELYSDSSLILSSVSSIAAEPLVWNHIAAVNDGATVKIYINGTMYANKAMNSPIPTMFRNYCYFCRDFSSPNNVNVAYLDDLKIYNRALNQQEINDDFMI